MSSRGGLFINIAGSVSRALLTGLAELRGQMGLLRLEADLLAKIDISRGIESIGSKVASSQNRAKQAFQETAVTAEKLIDVAERVNRAVADLPNLPQTHVTQQLAQVDKGLVGATHFAGQSLKHERSGLSLFPPLAHGATPADPGILKKTFTELNKVFSDSTAQIAHFRDAAAKMTTSVSAGMKSMGTISFEQMMKLQQAQGTLPQFLRRTTRSIFEQTAALQAGAQAFGRFSRNIASTPNLGYALTTTGNVPAGLPGYTPERAAIYDVGRTTLQQKMETTSLKSELVSIQAEMEKVGIKWLETVDKFKVGAAGKHAQKLEGHLQTLHTRSGMLKQQIHELSIAFSTRLVQSIQTASTAKVEATQKASALRVELFSVLNQLVAAEAELEKTTQKYGLYTKQTDTASRKVNTLATRLVQLRTELAQTTFAMSKSAQAIAQFGTAQFAASGTGPQGFAKIAQARQISNLHGVWDDKAKIDLRQKAYDAFDTARLNMWGAEVKKTTKISEMFRGAVERINHRLKQFAAFVVAAMVIQGIRRVFSQITTSIREFDQGLRDLQAIIKLTDLEMYKLGESVKRVASDTKYSTTEVMDGMKLLGQAGLEASEIIQAIDHVAALATGTLSDFETVSDLVTTTIRAFHMEFLETGRVADVFANAINRSKLTVDKLRVAFNYIAPVAHRAGISLEETTGALMLLANAGIRASTMGTGFRRVLLDLMKPNTALQTAIEQAGFSIRDFNPEFNSLATIFDRLAVVAPTASEAVHMFQTRALPVVMTFTTRGGDALKNFITIVEETGAAARMMAAQTEGLQIKFKQVKDRFTVLAVAIGQSGIGSLLHTIADSLRSTLSVMIRLTENGFLPFIAQVALLAVGLRVFIGLLANRLIPALITLRTAIFGVIGMNKLFIANFIALRMQAIATLGVLKGTMAALKAFLLLHGVGLIFTGISLAIMGVYYALTRKNRELDRTHKKLETQRDELKNVADALELYSERMAEANEKGESHLKYLERLIHDFPQLADRLKDVSLGYEDVKKAMEDLRKETAKERVDKITEQTAIAIERLATAEQKLQKMKDKRPSEDVAKYKHPRPIAWTLDKITGKASAQSDIEEYTVWFTDAILMEWVDALNVMGHTAHNAGQEVIAALKNMAEETGKPLDDQIKFVENYADALEKITSAKIIDPARMSKPWKDFIAQFDDETQSILKGVWTEYVDKMDELVTFHRNMGDDISEDEHWKEYWALMRQTEEEIFRLTGVHFSLNARMIDVHRALKQLGPGFTELYSKMNPVQMLDFHEGVRQIEKDMRELADKLREDRPGVNIEIAIDEERARLLGELAAKIFSNSFAKYMSELQIVENAILLTLESGSVKALNVQRDFLQQRLDAERKILARMQHPATQSSVESQDAQILQVQQLQFQLRDLDANIKANIEKENKEHFDKLASQRDNFYSEQLLGLESDSMKRLKIERERAKEELQIAKGIYFDEKEEDTKEDRHKAYIAARQALLNAEKAIQDELEKMSEQAFERMQAQRKLELELLKSLAEQETSEYLRIIKEHQVTMLELEMDHQNRIRKARESGESIETINQLYDVRKKASEDSKNKALEDLSAVANAEERQRRRDQRAIQDKIKTVEFERDVLTGVISEEQSRVKLAERKLQLTQEEIRAQELAIMARESESKSLKDIAEIGEELEELRRQELDDKNELIKANKALDESEFNRAKRILDLERQLAEAKISEERTPALLKSQKPGVIGTFGYQEKIAADTAEKLLRIATDYHRVMNEKDEERLATIKALHTADSVLYREAQLEKLLAFELRENEIARLEKQANEARIIAQGTFWQQLKLGSDRAKKNLEGWGEFTARLGEEMYMNFGRGFSAAFMEFVLGSEKASEAFRKFAHTFFTNIAQMIAQQLFFNAISGLGKLWGGGGGLAGMSDTMGAIAKSNLMQAATGNYTAPSYGLNVGTLTGLGPEFAKFMTHHEGGIVGQDGKQSMLNVADVLSSLPRFHEGLTPGGLKADEVLSVLQEGERVVSKSDVAEEKMLLRNINSLLERKEDRGVRIVNVLDPALFSDWASSSAGERVLKNFIKRNSAYVKQVMQ